LRRIVGVFMRVNAKCAHQLRPPSKVTGLSVDAQAAVRGAHTQPGRASQRRFR
jgi:hypothetical protein